MKQRSSSYPSRTLPEAEKFSISVFQNVGETVLKYAELAKHGNVPARDSDTYAVSAGQYGWMNKVHGKGYAPIASICTALKNPREGEKNSLFLQAFKSPPLYKALINSCNGKKITIEGLKIDLIRDDGFTDAGAAIAAKVFIDNAKFLGLINSDGIFNVDADIIIDINAVKDVQPKVKTPQSPITKKNTPIVIKPKKDELIIPPHNNHDSNSNTKKIAVFIRGKEFHFPVLDDMNQGDWDAVIKQIQNIKSFSK